MGRPQRSAHGAVGAPDQTNIHAPEPQALQVLDAGPLGAQTLMCCCRNTVRKFVQQHKAHIPFLGIILSDLCRVDAIVKSRKRWAQSTVIETEETKEDLAAAGSPTAPNTLSPAPAAEAASDDTFPEVNFGPHLQTFSLVRQVTASQQSRYPFQADYAVQVQCCACSVWVISNSRVRATGCVA